MKSKAAVLMMAVAMMVVAANRLFGRQGTL